MNIHFELKDIITAVGLTATLIVSIWSLVITCRNARKTLFINTVTNFRIKFMDNFRNNIAEYCGTVLHIIITDLDVDENRRLFENLDKLTYLVNLQLNRHDIYDKRLIEKLEKIEKMIDYEGKKDQKRFEDEVEAELKALVYLTQDFLKLEWEGVKQESVTGKLSKTLKANIIKKYLNNPESY